MRQACSTGCTTTGAWLFRRFWCSEAFWPRARWRLKPHQLSFDPSGAALARLAWRRYVRLVRPYVVALALAILLSALSRFLMSDPDTPAAPSLKQVLFHVLLIHDMAGVDALTTGVWYVAIDLQLYCMLLLLLWAAQRLAQVLRMDAQTLGLSLVVGLAALSLLWFNRDDTLEAWGIFFFGTYALGVMLQWISAGKSKQPWMFVMLSILVLALALDWRKPLIAAMLAAAFLGLGLHSKFRTDSGLARFVGWLSRMSYSVFLIHYPIVLLVGTIVARLWQENVSMAVIGFFTAWLMTLWVANAIHDRVEIACAGRRPFGSSV